MLFNQCFLMEHIDSLEWSNIFPDDFVFRMHPKNISELNELLSMHLKIGHTGIVRWLDR